MIEPGNCGSPRDCAAMFTGDSPRRGRVAAGPGVRRWRAARALREIFVGFFTAVFGGTSARISGPTGPTSVVMAGADHPFRAPVSSRLYGSDDGRPVADIVRFRRHRSLHKAGSVPRGVGLHERHRLHNHRVATIRCARPCAAAGWNSPVVVIRQTWRKPRPAVVQRWRRSVRPADHGAVFRAISGASGAGTALACRCSALIQAQTGCRCEK